MNEFTCEIPGFTIACKSWGNPDMPTILALHGWLDNANTFNLLAQSLQTDFYFIAVDLPGHGHSTHIAPGAHYHFIDGIFITLEIIKALKIKQPLHLIGHSMGACLASLLAGVSPESFASVVLIEAIGPFSSPEISCRNQLADYAQQLLEKNHHSHRPYPSLELAATTRSRNGHISFELATILCERGMLEDNGGFYWRHDRRLLFHSPLRLTEEQVLSCLSAIKAKTCLILADKGFIFDEDLINQRMNAINDLSVYYLKGGHHIHMENPESLSCIILEFYPKN